MNVVFLYGLFLNLVYGMIWKVFFYVLMFVLISNMVVLIIDCYIVIVLFM